MEKHELTMAEMNEAAGGYQDGIYNYKAETFNDQIMLIRKLARWDKEDNKSFQQCGRELVELNQRASNSLISDVQVYITVKEVYGIGDW